MPANTAPIFPLTPKLAFGKLTAANTAVDGTGTTAVIFTAGSNGARVDKIKARALGSNVATVARVFLNNGSSSATPTNNSLIGEIDLPATTASNAASIGPDIELLLDIAIPNGWTLLVCIGTAVSGGWQFSAVGGDY